MHACIWNCNYQIVDTRNKAKYRNPDMKKDSEREEATCSCIKKLIYLTHICTEIIALKKKLKKTKKIDTILFTQTILSTILIYL
jgi:hypothetical protein